MACTVSVIFSKKKKSNDNKKLISLSADCTLTSPLFFLSFLVNFFIFYIFFTKKSITFFFNITNNGYNKKKILPKIPPPSEYT